MTLLTRIALLACLLAFSAFTLRPTERLDISTPQKSFDALIEACQQNDLEALKEVATPTGLTSLIQHFPHDGDMGSLEPLGHELAASEVEWMEITEEIYFLSAKIDGKTHKMEFTLEEPGWMLYHWQIGGGVEH